MMRTMRRLLHSQEVPEGGGCKFNRKFRLDKNGAGAFRALRDKYEIREETQKALLMSDVQPQLQ